MERININYYAVNTADDPSIYLTHKETIVARKLMTKRGRRLLGNHVVEHPAARVLYSNLRLQITIQCHTGQHTATMAIPTWKKGKYGSKSPRRQADNDTRPVNALQVVYRAERNLTKLETRTDVVLPASRASSPSVVVLCYVGEIATSAPYC